MDRGVELSQKRKQFVKTDLSIPRVEHAWNGNEVSIPSDVYPPAITQVSVVDTLGAKLTFDFKRWYGSGIDEITYACQQQISRFIAKQDGELSPLTIMSYCQKGVRYFLDHLILVRTVFNRDLRLTDIDRNVIDSFIASSKGDSLSPLTQRGRYITVKSLLKALCRRGLIREVIGGDNATFPSNPFPGIYSTIKGEKPLSIAERKSFAVAIRKAVRPLFEPDVVVTTELLSYALLIIALHTGRNTMPLLEMRADALRPHPKFNTSFLILYKRRGHATSKVAVREARSDANEIESIPTLRTTVADVVRRVIELSRALVTDAPPEIRERVWLFRIRTGPGKGEVSTLKDSSLAAAINKLVRDYALVDADGNPLQLNVSRLRKTFVNRVFEILDGDIVTAAAAAGNTVRVAGDHYLQPGEDALGNWRFLGEVLTNELVAGNIGATEKTPVGSCSDVTKGEYAPKNRGGVCMSFLNCLRCRNYVVTADDLYRLFSFYWRILAERSRMDVRRWKKQLRHIVRLIDRDVVQAGISRKIFTREVVDRERERARINPHPFWRGEQSVTDLISLGAMR